MGVHIEQPGKCVGRYEVVPLLNSCGWWCPAHMEHEGVTVQWAGRRLRVIVWC